MEKVRPKFSIVEVWKEIRPKQGKVDSHRLVLNYHVIPKHSLITWMAILNRLFTKDRLISWGLEMGGTCCLCQNESKSRDHLFFWMQLF